METFLFEATQHRDGPYMNWGKFLVARYDQEWGWLSTIDEFGRSVVRACGWSNEHLWVMDIQTGEGAMFRPGGLARADLHKHRIWVCPLFEPFLAWLYTQDTNDIAGLPKLVELPNAEFQSRGYRRPGPQVFNWSPPPENPDEPPMFRETAEFLFGARSTDDHYPPPWERADAQNPASFTS